MPSNLNFVTQIFSRTVSLVKSRINSISKWTVKVQSFTSLSSQKIQENLAKYFQVIMSKPKSKKDYWKILGVYFSKRFCVMSVLVVGSVGLLFTNLVYPMINGKLWYGKIYTNTQKYDQFSGKAKVFDPSRNLIYQGEVKNGKVNGYGVQYSTLGKFIYKGNFNSNKYQGEGELYDENEKIIYRGNFENNKFHGSGSQMNFLGIQTFIGNFENGLKRGRGIQFDPKTGIKIFIGEFKNDKKDGSGIEFTPNGERIIYEGEFKEDKYNGVGKKYQESHLIYSGNFTDGLYSGLGHLYDKISGSIIYIGEFKNGLYDGSGQLFNSKNSKKIYEGEFENGKRHGEGVKYDNLGTVIYAGKYKNDGIDYTFFLGKGIEDLKNNFGEPDSKFEDNNFCMLTYLYLDSVIILKYNDKGDLECDKVIINTKNEYMGITQKSRDTNCISIFGDPFSSISLDLREDQKKAFKALSISHSQNNLPTDKFLFNDKYFIRCFYTKERSETIAIEIGKV